MDRVDCEESASRQVNSVFGENPPKRWLVAVFELLPNGEVSMKRTTHNFDLAKAEQAGSMLVGDLLRERDGSVIRTPLPPASGFSVVGAESGRVDGLSESAGSVAVSEGVATSD